jgi:hypothetical protein
MIGTGFYGLLNLLDVRAQPRCESRSETAFGGIKDFIGSSSWLKENPYIEEQL